jgi:hypothetical protein
MKWFVEAIVKPWHPTILGALVIAPLLYFGLPIVIDDATGCVSLGQCEKIEIGMTEELVIEILGTPGRNLTLMEGDLSLHF